MISYALGAVLKGGDSLTEKEIALQLTLKLLDENHFYHRSSGSSYEIAVQDAKHIAKVYNAFYEKINHNDSNV